MGRVERLRIAGVIIIETALLLRVTGLWCRAALRLLLAAEERAQTAEKAAALGLRMIIGALLFQLVHARFKLLDPVGCGLHALFLDEHGLREEMRAHRAAREPTG